MNKGIKIGGTELSSLMIVAILVPTLYQNRVLVHEATGCAHWIAVIVSFVFGLVGTAMLLTLLARFPGKNIVEIFKLVYGEWLGFLTSMILFLVFFMGVAVQLRIFIDAIKSYDYSLTPPSVLGVLMLITVGIICWLGVECVARISTIYLYLLIPLLILMLVLSAPEMHLHRLFPLLGHGAYSILNTGFMGSDMYRGILFVAVFADAFQGINTIKKSVFTGVLFSGMVIVITALCFNLMISYETVIEPVNDLFIFATMLEFGRFFQRLEVLLTFPLNVGAFIVTAIGMLGALRVYCGMFHIQSSRMLILPGAILLLTLAMEPLDYSTVIFVYSRSMDTTFLLAMYLIPLVTFATAIARGKKGCSRNG